MLRRKHTVDAVERAYQEALKAQRKAYEWCLELYKNELNRPTAQPAPQATILPIPPPETWAQHEAPVPVFGPTFGGDGDEYDEVAEDMAWLKSQGLVTDDEVAELMAAAGGFANPEVSDE